MPLARKSLLRDDLLWRVAGFVIGLPLVVVLALSALSAASDRGRVPSEIAASARQTGVMRCSEGTIERADGSFLERLLDTGRFRCTAWRMRQRVFDSSTSTTVWPTSPRR